MKFQVLLVFSVYLQLLRLFSQSEGAVVWSEEAQVTAVQGESATLDWNVTLTDSDVNKAWTYVKIQQAEGGTTEALVTFQPSGTITIDNPSYNSRRSDMTFNVSQSGPSVIIRFKVANLVRATDMKSYKAVLGFSNDASTCPGVTVLTILVKPHSTELKIKPEKNAFCLGNQATFTCKAQGIPPAQISLLLNNRLLQKQNTTLSTLLTFSVKGENNFSCVPSNAAGVGPMRSVKLIVKEPPKLDRCRINNKEVTTNSVTEGTLVTLSCIVGGSEPLTIDWHKDNAPSSLSQSNTLTFGSISRRDTGQYRLTAYNGRECDKTVTEVFQVTVIYLDEPMVDGNRYRVVSATNREAKFKITVNANPQPSLVCRREGVPGNVSVETTTSGSISTFSVHIYVKKNFAGDEKYTCTLKNTAVTRNVMLELYKKTAPKSMKGSFEMTNMNWTLDLYSTNSNYYKVLEMNVTQALNQVYGELVSKVEVKGFVKGSVIVNFKLYIVADIENPIFLLVSAVEKNGGKINTLVISLGSIKAGYAEDKHWVGPAADRSSGSDHKIGIGIAVGTFFLLLAGMAIC